MRIDDTLPKTVACPNCGKPVPWIAESKWRPFCNKRCRLIDLGEWFSEGHRLSEPIEDGYAPPTREENDGSHHS